MAQQVGHLTRFPSLELTCDSVRKAGNCDSGYSCAYEYNLSWHSAHQPLSPEPNPRLVFERLFGTGSREERINSLKRRQEEQYSILDFVMADAGSIQKKMSGRDQQELDQYVKTDSTPLTNLFLSMADRMGVQGLERHGDSTGRLAVI